jgi:hypothetical protein
MSMKKPKLIYKIKNLFSSMKNKITPTRKGKRCVSLCAHCGDLTPQDSRLKFHDIKKQPLDTLMFSLNDKTTMHCSSEISNFSAISDELGVAHFCYGCGTTFKNTLILKILDIVVVVFI